VYKKDGTWI